MGRIGSCDFHELTQFTKRLEQLTDKRFEAFCQAAAKELAARLLSKVIRRTPVGETNAHKENLTDDEGNTTTYQSGPRKGTVKQRNVTDHMGGTLRRGWTARTEQEAEGGQTATARDYAQALPVIHTGGVYQIEIINPVHYASYVEYGHRQTPGRFVPAIGKRLKAGWVKGRFMLTISEQELQAQAPALLERKLTQFLEGFLNGH